jgi:curved DNA-binding protein CbpA
MTFYEILQVPLTATFEEIKTSYQSKARMLHPDKQNRSNKGGNASTAREESFLALQKAWECLRDPQRRKDYDLELYQTTTGKTSKSIPVSIDEWELVQDEETDELGYMYACRCGEDIWLSQDNFEQDRITTSKTFVDSSLVPCEGCSSVYRIISKKK